MIFLAFVLLQSCGANSNSDTISRDSDSRVTSSRAASDKAELIDNEINKSLLEEVSFSEEFMFKLITFNLVDESFTKEANKVGFNSLEDLFSKEATPEQEESMGQWFVEYYKKTDNRIKLLRNIPFNTVLDSYLISSVLIGLYNIKLKTVSEQYNKDYLISLIMLLENIQKFTLASGSKLMVDDREMLNYLVNNFDKPLLNESAFSIISLLMVLEMPLFELIGERELIYGHFININLMSYINNNKQVQFEFTYEELKMFLYNILLKLNEEKKILCKFSIKFVELLDQMKIKCELDANEVYEFIENNWIGRKIISNKISHTIKLLFSNGAYKFTTNKQEAISKAIKKVMNSNIQDENLFFLFIICDSKDEIDKLDDLQGDAKKFLEDWIDEHLRYKAKVKVSF